MELTALKNAHTIHMLTDQALIKRFNHHRGSWKAARSSRI